MPSFAQKVDKNQSEIVKTLRSKGFSVFLTHKVGCGFPDLIAGKDGINYLIEVKTEKGKLSQKQIDFHAAWQGKIIVVRTLEDLEDL